MIKTRYRIDDFIFIESLLYSSFLDMSRVISRFFLIFKQNHNHWRILDLIQRLDIGHRIDCGLEGPSWRQINRGHDRIAGTAIQKCHVGLVRVRDRVIGFHFCLIERCVQLSFDNLIKFNEPPNFFEF